MGGRVAVWVGTRPGMLPIGCAVLGWADGWRGRCSGWSGGIGGNAGQPEGAASLGGRGSAGRSASGLPLGRLRARGLGVRLVLSRPKGTGRRAVCSARRTRSSAARRSVRARDAPREPCCLRQWESEPLDTTGQRERNRHPTENTGRGARHAATVSISEGALFQEGFPLGS